MLSPRSGQRCRMALVVAAPGLEGCEEDIPKDVTGVIRTDPATKEPEDRLSVAIEDLPEPTNVAKRLLDQLSVGRTGHTPSLPPGPNSVRVLLADKTSEVRRPPSAPGRQHERRRSVAPDHSTSSDPVRRNWSRAARPGVESCTLQLAVLYRHIPGTRCSCRIYAWA
jgi:hypothetical protein